MTSTTALYRTLWRWHFYAGIFCLPFILTLSISGAIYLFKPQIDAWVDSPYRNLDIAGERALATAHIAAALQALPNAEFLNYRLTESNADAVVVTVRHHGEPWLVYLHPETLTVLKTIAVDSQFVRQVRAFHGELMAGKVGAILVELAGSWAIVLIITGLYLWWPRNARGMAGIIYPRWRAGQRQFWRDLHAVTGVWMSGFTLFLLVSGLPWALVWGSVFNELREWNASQSVQQDWSVVSTHHHETRPLVINHAIELPERVVEKAKQLHFASPVELSAVENKNDQWQLKSQTQNRPMRAEAILDGNGNLLSLKQFSDRAAVDRVIGFGVAAHEGQLFGWLNQLLGLITALGLIAIVISAFVLWRQRKPANNLGALPVPKNASIVKVVTIIILVMSLLLPVLALSLVGLLLLEKLFLQRVSAVRLWLGLQ